MRKLSFRYGAVLLCLLGLCKAAIGRGEQTSTPSANEPRQQTAGPPPAEDISGMYSFLREGEFVQINIDGPNVTGYISRLGDMESDRGTFLDQFFSKASVQDHDVAFTTKPIHGVWFEFKGRFDRGPAKSKSQDGYYVLRGTLSEFVTDSEKKTSSRSRQVELKLLAQPQELEDKEKSKDRQKSQG